MSKLGNISVECFRTGTKGKIPYRIFDLYEKSEPSNPHYDLFKTWMLDRFQDSPVVLEEMEYLASLVLKGEDQIICYAHNDRHQAYYCDVIKELIFEAIGEHP